MGDKNGRSKQRPYGPSQKALGVLSEWLVVVWVVFWFSVSWVWCRVVDVWLRWRVRRELRGRG